jgi:hypothetical protein
VRRCFTIIRLLSGYFQCPALSWKQEQLNFFSDRIAAATILATKALGGITLWSGFGVWRWSAAASASQSAPGKGTTIQAQMPLDKARAGGGAENPLMDFAEVKKT